MYVLFEGSFLPLLLAHDLPRKRSYLPLRPLISILALHRWSTPNGSLNPRLSGRLQDSWCIR